MKDNKIPTKGKTTRKNGKKTPKTDYFVLLCRKYLGVECVKEYRFHPTRRWRFDYAFPQYRVALEVEGGVWTYGRHTRPKGFLGDVEKYNAAAMLGWRLLRTTPSKLCTLQTLKDIKTTINLAECL